MILLYIGLVQGLCLILWVLCCCARIGCLGACCGKYSQQSEENSRPPPIHLAPYTKNPPSSSTSPKFITPILPIHGGRQNGPTWSTRWANNGQISL